MDGTLRIVGDAYELHYTRHLTHSVQQVWRALVEPGRVVEWLAEAEIEPVVGGRVQLRWLNTDEQGNTAVARGTVVAIDPTKLLEYVTDIHGRLRWSLQEEGEGALITFTATLPGPIPGIERILAGWQIHLDHLADALEGRPVNWPTWMADHYGRWSEYRDRYAIMLSQQSE